MILQIDKEKVYHYILIYLLIISQGSVLFNKYQNYFLVLFFLISTVFVLKRRYLLQTVYMLFLYMLAVDFVLVMFLTNGGLSVFSVGNIISRFMLPYVAYQYNKEKFVQRFVNTVTFFAMISLVTFVIQMTSYDTITKLWPVYVKNPTMYYGGFLSTVVGWHSKRNIGLATEPGRYQVYLIAALYMLLFKRNQINVTQEKYKFIFLLLLLTIISTQSTTGYLALLVVIVGFLLNKQEGVSLTEEKSRKGVFHLLMVGLVVLVIYMSVTGTDNFIYKNFINKLFNSSGDLDLYASSGGSRMISILTDLSIALKNPLGMGYEPYQSVWAANKVGISSDYSSCVGLTSSCAALGFPAVILMLGFYIRFAWVNKKNVITFIILLLILINTSLAQPLLYFSPMIVIFLIEEKRSEINYDNM